MFEGSYNKFTMTHTTVCHECLAHKTYRGPHAKELMLKWRQRHYVSHCNDHCDHRWIELATPIVV